MLKGTITHSSFFPSPNNYDLTKRRCFGMFQQTESNPWLEDRFLGCEYFNRKRNRRNPDLEFCIELLK